MRKRTMIVLTDGVGTYLAPVEGSEAKVCLACGTRLRPGQPHSALKPWPHEALNMLMVAK